MKTSGSSRSEAGIGNTLGECIGAALAVIISLILLVGSMTLINMLALGPIGAFWFWCSSLSSLSALSLGQRSFCFS
jgi:uncharacterized membrane protein (Fun14 family)